MNYIAECLQKFRDLPEDVQAAYDSVEFLLIINSLEEKYKVKLSFLIILVAINELENEDIEDYLIKKFNLSKEAAVELKEVLVKEVLDPAFERSLALDKEIDDILAEPVNDKTKIITIFSEQLINNLQAKNSEITSLNIFIFKAFNTYSDLEEKAINALYANQENIGTKRITLEDHEVGPTVAHWLKDFIKLNGSELFDEIVLVQYFADSANVKKLNAEEKKLLRKLLKLYRNLVFFPESLENVPLEKWELFPTDSALAPIENQTQVKTKVTSPAPAPAPAPSLQEELETSLKNYSVGSLEYKVLKQEIARLKKKHV